MEDLHCKKCKTLTEHEDYNGTFICSICGLEFKKEKVMAKGKGKGRRLSPKKKEDLMNDLLNRSKSGDSINKIAKRHGVALSTAVYYSKKEGLEALVLSIPPVKGINRKQKRRWKSKIVKVGKNMETTTLKEIYIEQNKLLSTKCIIPKLKSGKILMASTDKTPETFKDGLLKVMLELSELMIKKQTDYGHRNITDCGIVGIIVKLNDKIAELKNLYGFTDGSFQKKEALNESIADCFRDIANYAAIALMLEDGTFTLPLIADMEKDNE